MDVANTGAVQPTYTGKVTTTTELRNLPVQEQDVIEVIDGKAYLNGEEVQLPEILAEGEKYEETSVFSVMMRNLTNGNLMDDMEDREVNRTVVRQGIGGRLVLERISTPGANARKMERVLNQGSTQTMMMAAISDGVPESVRQQLLDHVNGENWVDAAAIKAAIRNMEELGEDRSADDIAGGMAAEDMEGPKEEKAAEVVEEIELESAEADWKEYEEKTM